MSTPPRKKEIDANYDFLQRSLALLLPQHEGQYALLKNKRVEGFFNRPGDAYREAMERFPDRLFSIQLVTGEPLDLGFLSYAGS